MNALKKSAFLEVVMLTRQSADELYWKNVPLFRALRAVEVGTNVRHQ